MGNAQSRQDSFLSAARHGRLKDVEALLKQDDVRVDAADEHGTTALMHASSCGYAKIARLLLKEGADVDATDENQSTALMIAAEHGHTNVAKLLLDHKADVDATDEHQWTALMFAAQFGHVDVTRLLLERNANVNLVNNKGNTSTQFAADNGHLEIVRLLFTKYADVNSIDADGDTPLICSAMNGHTSIVEMLLKQGANVGTRNHVGKCALEYAVEQGHKDITQMIQAVITQTPIKIRRAQEPLPGSLTPAPALMRQVKSLCGTMQEAEAICTHIYSRLLGLGQQLLTSGFIEKQALRNEYMAILERFRLFLGQYGNKRTITRAVSGRMMISVCQELHETLDKLIELCEGGILGDFVEWKERFEADSKTYRGLLRSVLERDQSWKNELRDAETQAEALTLLLFEHDRRAEEYDPDELEWIYRIFGSVARLSKLGIPSIPAWFLPPHEVHTFGDQIGGGAYGSVHLGLWRGASVVVKSIIFHENAENHEMFKKEADIWSSLQHPHIVKLFGACHVGNPFFVCEHASNGSLVDYLYHNENRHKTWKCLHEAALGLSYLHTKKQIVHLDIKGDNILVFHDGVTKLTDFGLSCRNADLDLTGDGAVVGALCWKAPEFISGESSGSFACDVYSFGMTIYEVVTQRMPYGTMADATIKGRVKRNLHKLPSKPDEMRENQWDLIKRMCSTNPSDRIDMETVVQELKAFAEEELNSYLQNEWELEKQKKISLLQASHTTSAALVTLDQMKPLCDTMEEARSMCLHIYSRLFSLGELLSNTQIIEKELFQNENAAILERFHTFLVHYGNKRAVSRIVIGPVISSACQMVHEKLDDLIKLCEVDVLDDILQWKDQFLEDSETHREALRFALKTTQDQLMNEVQHKEVQVEALTLLLSKQNHFEGMYDSDELQLINLLFRSVPRLSRLGIPAVPTWFLPPHEVEFSNYSCFARGSWASVYHGIWMGITIALRFVFVREDLKRRQIFLKEAELWSSLQHPHIVKLYGACHVGNPFFVCELATNGTLVDYLSREENRHKKWKCLHEAALGLYYLHAKQEMVHLDIKGNNILVDGNGVAKLADFTTSRHVDVLPHSIDASEVGAINWKAPEIISGDSNGSFASDVYSFGMTIIEVVAGRVPWGMMPDVTVKHMVVKQMKIPTQPEEMSDSQWDLIKRMCCTNPVDRIHMATVVQQLDEFAETSKRKQ